MIVFSASCVISFFVFITWYAWWHFGGIVKTERQRSFVITLFSSCVMTLCSVPILYEAMTSPQGFMTVFAPATTWTIAASTFFMMSLVCDLGIGAIFYRNKINLLTGWIHHTVYILILFYLIHYDLSRFFLAMCILELPTLSLSVSSVFPEYRQDYIFASFYVPTRIGFHAFMIGYCIVVVRPFLVDITLGLIVLFPLHCYWFYGFILQQKRLWEEKNFAAPIVDTLQPATPTVHGSKETILVVAPSVSAMNPARKQTASYAACSTLDRPTDSTLRPILVH